MIQLMYVCGIERRQIRKKEEKKKENTTKLNGRKRSKVAVKFITDDRTLTETFEIHV